MRGNREEGRGKSGCLGVARCWGGAFIDSSLRRGRGYVRGICRLRSVSASRGGEINRFLIFLKTVYAGCRSDSLESGVVLDNGLEMAQYLPVKPASVGCRADCSVTGIAQANMEHGSCPVYLFELLF